MRRTVVFIMFLIGHFLTGNAYAISPDNHQLVTKVAMIAYKNCTIQLGIMDSLTEGLDTIVELSGLEDESPLIKRYFNWHFYDAYKDEASAMGRSFTGARKSLHHIYNERSDSLIEALKKNQKDDVYEYTGRLIHYIQDMTVPVHVAPIYHYEFLWFDESDYFDKMPEWGTTSFTQAANLCLVEQVDIVGIKQRFNAILEKTAHRTRDRIREKILAEDGHRLKDKTWEEFWVLRNPDDDHKYSGTKLGFAPYGNQKKYGFKKLCEARGSDRELCLGFFKQSFDNAITSTVKILLLINNINLKYIEGS